MLRASCSCTALVALRDGVPVCSACGATLSPLVAVTPRPFSQIDGERPAGVGRARYLRAWHRGDDANDPDVTEDGRARLMTPAGLAVAVDRGGLHAELHPEHVRVGVLRELGEAVA